VRRVIVYGSDSGFRLWGLAVNAIPGYEVVRAEYPAARTGLLNPVPLSSIRDVQRLSREADAVLALSTLLGTAAGLAARSIPVVAIDIGGARVVERFGPAMRLPLAALACPLTAVVALTTAHATALKGILAGMPTRVARQPANPPAYSWKPDRDTPYVLCAGSSGRDLGLLCEAARELPIQVRLIEGGRELAPARGTRIPAHCSPNVVRSRRVPRPAYLDLLRGASALVHPLPHSNYPVGITVLLDAMSAGVPVVATDVPSVSEYQAAGTAALVPTGSARAMAQAIQRVVADESWAQSLSESSRRHVNRIASPTVVGAQLGLILREFG
jgi:hypothetical protein